MLTWATIVMIKSAEWINIQNIWTMYKQNKSCIKRFSNTGTFPPVKHRVPLITGWFYCHITHWTLEFSRRSMNNSSNCINLHFSLKLRTSFLGLMVFLKKILKDCSLYISNVKTQPPPHHCGPPYPRVSWFVQTWIYPIWGCFYTIKL